MIRSLIKLILVLTIGILVYNYFLGSDTEKENARKIFKEVKELGVAVKDLLKSEKEKFDSGKYDEALDKIGGLFKDLKRKAEDLDENYVDRIAELDEKRKALEERLAELKDENDIPDSYENESEFTEKGSREMDKIKRELRDLMEETEKVMNEMERQ